MRGKNEALWEKQEEVSLRLGAVGKVSDMRKWCPAVTVCCESRTRTMARG